MSQLLLATGARPHRNLPWRQLHKGGHQIRAEAALQELKQDQEHKGWVYQPLFPKSTSVASKSVSLEACSFGLSQEDKVFFSLSVLGMAVCQELSLTVTVPWESGMQAPPPASIVR